jgi:hypothetical protein
MKRKGKLAEPHSGARRDHLKARHQQKAKRAADSMISAKEFGKKKAAKQATKKAQKRNRRK